MYQYKAHVTEVYDGDTITVSIDLGFDMTFHDVKVRMHGINAPEMKGAAHDSGAVSRDALRGRILDKDVILHTYRDKQEKYGRYLADVFLGDEDINAWMVEKQFAVRYMVD